MSFLASLSRLPVDELLETANEASPAAVERALGNEQPDLRDFAALLSPSAAPALEQMALRARDITARRFGKTIQLYAPLYVSNECVQTCSYCAFARPNPIPRRTLTRDEAVAESRILIEQGFRHLLVVSGEHPRHVSADYLRDVIAALHREVPSVSVEVQPETVEVYEQWVRAGAEGLIVYQETYDREVYKAVHLAGRKRRYDWRLASVERGAEGGMKRLGIGALLGLADWRREAIHLAAHARYLMRRYWKAFVTISLPRLRSAAFASHVEHPVSDRDLARLVCALRIFLPDVGLILSTRERPAFRDGMLALGITQMSAGSRTEPGGYSAPERAEPQFAIEDTRSAEAVAEVLRERGYDPVWKDWEGVLNERPSVHAPGIDQSA